MINLLNIDLRPSSSDHDDLQNQVLIYFSCVIFAISFSLSLEFHQSAIQSSKTTTKATISPSFCELCWKDHWKQNHFKTIQVFEFFVFWISKIFPFLFFLYKNNFQWIKMKLKRERENENDKIINIALNNLKNFAFTFYFYLASLIFLCFYLNSIIILYHSKKEPSNTISLNKS